MLRRLQHNDTGYSLDVENCRIFGNKRNGIYTLYSVPMILNSLIYKNGSGGSSYYGISTNQATDNPAIRNNTIVYNENEGIKFTGNYVPDIRNCILWYNNEEGGLGQLTGYETTYYSCVTDPNDLDGTSTPDGNGSISCDPNFAYDYGEFGYYHLDPGSACIDTGTPNEPYTGEEDIDTEARVYNSRVDMGADEVDCSDVSNEVDWNADGIVNNLEFAMFSTAWLLDDTDPNWSDTYSKYDLVEDDEIDIEDLAVFCGELLWEACWRDSQEDIWMMMAGGYGMESTAIGAAKAVVSEPTLEEQIDSAKAFIKWFEEIQLDEEVQEAIDEKQWEEFMEEINQWLDGLEELL